jgi:peroxiredoxin Q/BCP
MLETGTKAPAFSLPDQNGTMHSLADYRGQKVILYFYPKDMTSGCTSQACSFRDLWPQIREKGAVVLGVSRDSVASHKRFEEKHGLPFPLLADEQMEVIAAYDVLRPGKDGKPGKGLIRTTYLIDEDGVIVQALGGVKPKENPAQMLAAIGQGEAQA